MDGKMVKVVPCWRGNALEVKSRWADACRKKNSEHMPQKKRFQVGGHSQRAAGEPSIFERPANVAASKQPCAGEPCNFLFCQFFRTKDYWIHNSKRLGRETSFRSKRKRPCPAQSVFGGRHGGIDGVGKMKALAKHAPLQIVMILFKVLKDERVKMR